MDNYVKKIIDEAFKSKAQQRLFYAKAGNKSLPKKTRKKWKKWSKEFSDETDFENLPEKVKNEEEIEEVVDEFGNIARHRIPITKDSVGASKKTTDQVVKTAAGTMGTHGVHGTHTTLKYWAENDMSKALGFKDTMGKDKPVKKAKEFFKKELDVDEPEADEKLTQYGYDEKLPGDKIRLVENPKKFIRDYVESILNKKSSSSELVKKDQQEEIEKELEPIIKKQIAALKNTLEKNNISVKEVIKFLNKDDSE